MEFLRWLALDKYREFATTGVFAPVIFVNLLALGILGGLLLAAIGGFIATTIWLLLFTLSIAFWAIYAFLFAQETYQRELAEFKKTKNKP